MDPFGAHDELIARRLPTMRVIVVALVVGVLTFVGVVVFLGQQPAGQPPLPPAPGWPLLTSLAVTLFVANAVLALVMTNIMTRAGRQQIARTTPMPGANDADRLLNVYQTRTILGAALLEGAAFLGATAAMVEGNSIGLGVAGAAVLLLVVLFYPTQGRVSQWLTTQLDALDQDRRAGELAGGR